MALFLIFGACIPLILFLGAIGFSPDSEEFLVFAAVLTLAVIIGSLIMMSLPNH